MKTDFIFLRRFFDWAQCHRIFKKNSTISSAFARGKLVRKDYNV